MTEDISFGSNIMVKIDGDKIRRLREVRAFTQLYIATVVGVTTDTISRWENRRYPSIKRENALKLAEALETDLAEILENGAQEATAAAAADEAAVPQAAAGEGPRAGKKAGRIFVFILAASLLAGGLAWWQQAGKQTATVSAYRLLPPHIPAGQIFPVIIQVDSEGDAVPLIIKETLPAGCVPVKAAPPFTNIDKKSGVLKWISRGGGQRSTFAYLAQSPPTAGPGQPQLFSGTVTVGREGSRAENIKGMNSMTVADLHWADANGDNRIVDEEILSVYDRFAALDGLGFDWNGIDDIWSGRGYRWDAAAQTFVIIE